MRNAYLPLQKWMTYSLSMCTVSQKSVTLVHGTLQHLTFVYCDGRHALSSISSFPADFQNNFIKLQLLYTVQSQLLWWKSVLSLPSVLYSLQPLPHLDPLVWVDTSSSWGIGLIIGSKWVAWKLLPGWHAHVREIGWAECITLELVVYYLVERGLHDADITIRSDNSEVIGVFWKGCSCWNSLGGTGSRQKASDTGGG